MTEHSTSLSRRGLLGGLAVAGGVAGSGGLLAGCGEGGSGAKNNSAANNEKVELPAYVPFKAVPPDLPGNNRGVVPGYLRYPGDPVRGGSELAAKGLKLTVMVPVNGALPPPKKQNLWWREIDRHTGADLDLLMLPNVEYAKKFATVVAGNDLPDITMLSAEAPRRAALLAAKFQDLTEWLSGDAVKEYPFLANLPTEAWHGSVYNGGIYGLPMHRSVTGHAVFYRADLLEKRGLDPQPKSFAEFRKLCQDLTDPRTNHWALGGPNDVLGFVRGMVGTPNDWAEKGGTFTATYETEEYKQALDAVLKLVKDGVFDPDSFTSDTVVRKDWFGTGRITIHVDGYSAWPGFTPVQFPGSKGFRADAMVEPGFDGGKGTRPAGGPSYGISVFKKAPKKRIEQLLRFADWCAAPFGTEEHLFRKYGLAGAHHAAGGTDPVLTDRGTREQTVSLALAYVTDAPYVIYLPGYEDIVRAWWKYQERALPLMVPNPTFALYSDAASSKGPKIGEQLLSTRMEILQGRKKLSEWDQAVRDWRTGGGDEIRREYEEAFAAANG